MNFEELVTVYSVSNAVKAEIIKNFLQSENIPCFIDGAHQAGDAGLMGLAVKLQVPASDAKRARQLIDERETRHEEEQEED